MKFGLCQLSADEGNYKENLALMERFVSEYSSRGIDVLCFPELPITGYDYDEVAARAVDEGAALAALAKKYKQAIFSGYACYDGDFYDAAGFWDENGKQLCEYKKIHLVRTETNMFTPGQDVQTFEYRGWRMGMLICADLAFADLPKIMALRGCSAVLCCSAWVFPYDSEYQVLVKARACENRMFAVSVNRATGNEPFCGNSMVVGPKGQQISRVLSDKQDFAAAELSLQDVAAARAEVPWLQIRRPDIYEREYLKLNEA